MFSLKCKKGNTSLAHDTRFLAHLVPSQGYSKGHKQNVFLLNHQLPLFNSSRETGGFSCSIKESTPHLLSSLGKRSGGLAGMMERFYVVVSLRQAGCANHFLTSSLGYSRFCAELVWDAHRSCAIYFPVMPVEPICVHHRCAYSSCNSGVYTDCV